MGTFSMIKVGEPIELAPGAVFSGSAWDAIAVSGQIPEADTPEPDGQER